MKVFPNAVMAANRSAWYVTRQTAPDDYIIEYERMPRILFRVLALGWTGPPSPRSTIPGTVSHEIPF